MQKPTISRDNTSLFVFPQADLIDDRCRQQLVVAAGRDSHLGMGARSQVSDNLDPSTVSATALISSQPRRTDLIRRDPVRETAANTLARDVARNKVGEARLEMGKEAEDGNLQGVRGIRVELVVCFED